MSPRAYLPCLLILAGLAHPRPARGDEGPKTGDCLECHEDPGLTREDGRPIVFDQKQLAASVHGDAGIECVECHTDLASTARFPHPAKLSPVHCAGCHEKAAADYGKSVHARARDAAGGGTDAASCHDCHGSHDIRPRKDPESRTNHFQVPQTCGRCHGDPKLIARAKIAIGDTFHKFKDSIHGKALSKSGLVVAPNCSDCHRAHDILAHDDPASPVRKTNVPATCGTCHEGILLEYRQGIHGEALAKGNQRAPACSDCHSAHQIASVETATWRLGVLRECGTCHDDYIKTYRDTYHGKVTSLGFERIATCSDCHGAHAVFPEKDPRSTVAAANRADTCRRCHPGTNENFAAYDPHVDPGDPERNAAIYYTQRFMVWLLAGVFSFFGLHTGLWLLRELLDRRRGRASAGGA